MSIESIDIELGKSAWGEPIYDNATGDQTQDPSLWRKFNVQQGRQLGLPTVSYFLAMFTSGMTHDPGANFDLGYSLHLLGRPTLLMIYDSYFFGDAHVIRPYDWELATGKIIVADSNKPYQDWSAVQTVDVTRGADGYSSFYYEGNGHTYLGDRFGGGRMYITPYDLVAGRPTTPLALFTPWELLDNGMLAMFGSTGKTRQITDDQGRTFFKDDLPGLPTKWDDIKDESTRVPKIAPIPGTGGNSYDGQLFAGKGLNGETQQYDVVGTTAGTSYEAGFSTAMLGSHFKVPGSPDKADQYTLSSINAEGRTMAFKIPEDGTQKQIAWTVSGITKTLWTEFGDMGVAPGQRLAMSVESGGSRITVDNQGPATSAHIIVTDAVAGTKNDAGRVDIPSGTKTIGVLPPVARCAAATVPTTPSSCSAGASVDADSYDPSAGVFTVTQSPAGPYALGTTSVTLTATNALGFSSSCTANVTVEDKTAPVFTWLPEDINVYPPCTPDVVLQTPHASDNCAGAVVPTHNAPSKFPVGVTIVTWTADDGHGNVKTYQQKVTVNASHDLGAEHTISSVRNDSCLTVTKYPNWAPWINSIRIQPQAQGVGWPIPFTWKNCNTSGAGSLPAPWQEGVAAPIKATCPTNIKLGGNGTGSVSLTWWANG